MASKICGKTRAAGSRIVAPRRSGSTHLHRPWRPSIRQSTTACPDGGVFRAVTSGTATMRRLQRVPLPACRAGIASITVFPGLSVGRNDRPQNGIVNAKVLVTNTVADRFDLAPWLGRKVRESVVWNAPHSLRYGLDRLASCATNYRIIPKGVQGRAGLDVVQDRDLGEAVANRNGRVLRHYETRMASRSIFSFMSG
jgi:hypothetical protein